MRFHEALDHSIAPETSPVHDRGSRPRGIDELRRRTAASRSSGETVNGGAVAGRHLGVESPQRRVYHAQATFTDPPTPLAAARESKCPQGAAGRAHWAMCRTERGRGSLESESNSCLWSVTVGAGVRHKGCRSAPSDGHVHYTAGRVPRVPYTTIPTAPCATGATCSHGPACAAATAVHALAAATAHGAHAQIHAEQGHRSPPKEGTHITPWPGSPPTYLLSYE